MEAGNKKDLYFLNGNTITILAQFRSSLLKIKDIDAYWELLLTTFKSLGYPCVRIYDYILKDETYVGVASCGISDTFTNDFKSNSIFKIRRNEIKDKSPYILTSRKISQDNNGTLPEWAVKLGFPGRIKQSWTSDLSLGDEIILGAISIDKNDSEAEFTDDESWWLWVLTGFMTETWIRLKPQPVGKGMIVSTEIKEIKQSKAWNIAIRKESECGLIYNAAISDHSLIPLFHLLNASANSKDNLLIFAETGTGKYLVSEWLAEKNLYFQGLHRIDCTRITEDSLFGVKGRTFTEVNPREGLLKVGEGKTTLLDEIGELEEGLQSLLLTSLEKPGTIFFKMKGEDRIETNVNTRVIASTTKLPRQEIKGRLGDPIIIPPLRERKYDIPVLVNYFIECYTERKLEKVYITKAAGEALMKYDWPENVRQLENTIRRCILLCQANNTEIITLAMLHEDIKGQNNQAEDFNNSIQVYPIQGDNNGDILLNVKNMNSDSSGLTENARSIIELIKKNGRQEFENIFPFKDKNDINKKNLFKIIIDGIQGDKDNYIIKEFNDPQCEVCGKAPIYKLCEESKKKKKGCNKIIPPGVFRDRIKAYGFASTIRGRPKKSKNDGNLGIIIAKTRE